MKVLLINPPIIEEDVMRDFRKFERMRGIYPPLGLLYIASTLLECGHEVKVIDCDAEDGYEEIIKETCRSFCPDVAGFYAFTWTYRKAARLAGIVKSLVPGVTTVIGGPNATSFPKLSLQYGDFDYAVKSEGEETVKELMEAVAGKRLPENIPGLAYKVNGRVLENENRPFIQDLNSISFPARQLVHMDRYSDIFSREKGLTTMVASRGCPYNCSFCDRKNRMGKIWRSRSPANVIREMQQIMAEYGIREFMFFDDNFVIDRDWVFKFCRELEKAGLDVLWEIRTRVDTVDEQVLKAIKEAGCYRIRFGFESGDNAILKIMKKGITVEQSLECARLCHKVGIEMFGYFILGAPGETEETMERTIELAVEIEPHFALFSKFVPYPCTEAFQWAVDHDYIDESYWVKFLAGEDLDSNPVLDQRQLPAHIVERYVDKANRRFYFRPCYIFRSLRGIRNPKQLGRHLRIAKTLL